MKRIYLVIFLMLIISTDFFSQNGTIKIVKPVQKDTVIKKDILPKQRFLTIVVEAGSNYSFKGNNKIGYNGGITFVNQVIFIGIQYAFENQYYQLSPFNNQTLQVETYSGKSENKSEYFKLPVGLMANLNIGPSSNFQFSIGLTPEYLLKNNNQYNRLNYNNFNRYNLSGNISFGIPIKKSFHLSFRYSKDFFENLKDRKIYNSNGEAIEKQKSKTNLISFSLEYTLKVKVGSY